MLVMMTLGCLNCVRKLLNGFFRHEEFHFLFKDKRLCVPKGSLCELLIREVHEEGLVSNFGVDKTSDIFHLHFFWSKMKHDVNNNKYCFKCIVCH